MRCGAVARLAPAALQRSTLTCCSAKAISPGVKEFLSASCSLRFIFIKLRWKEAVGFGSKSTKELRLCVGEALLRANCHFDAAIVALRGDGEPPEPAAAAGTTKDIERAEAGEVALEGPGSTASVVEPLSWLRALPLAEVSKPRSALPSSGADCTKDRGSAPAEGCGVSDGSNFK